MFNPKISIVIPVYNGSNYLRQAIDSAINQTYSNVEVIVINDGSNDDTHEIALGYGDKIRYFKKENGGVATALNLGIKKMSGDYFSWLSHDDIYYPHKIESQVNTLTGLVDKNTILYGPWNTIDSESKIIGEVLLARYDLKKLNLPLFPILNGIIHGCSLLVPVSCFKDLGLFNEELKTTQDYELWFRFLRKYPIYFSKEVLIQSRSHGQQTSKLMGHFDEENKLWINIFNSITENEAINLSGSYLNFILEISKFLKETPYKKAYKYTVNAIRKYKIKMFFLNKLNKFNSQK